MLPNYGTAFHKQNPSKDVGWIQTWANLFKVKHD